MRTTGIETWNRLKVTTGGWNYGGKKGKGLAKYHVPITHGHGQQCGNCQWEWGQAGRRRATREKLGHL